MIKTTKKYAWVIFVFIGGMILFFPGKAQVQNEPEVPLDVPIAMNDIDRNPKIESRLNQLIHIYENHGLEMTKQMAEAMNIEMVDDTVQIVGEGRALQIPGKYTFDVGALKARMEALGGHVETHYESLVQGTMPFYSLRSLAELPEVDYVRLPYYARPMAPAKASSRQGLTSIITSPPITARIRSWSASSTPASPATRPFSETSSLLQTG
jgi:hypothetical protein